MKQALSGGRIDTSNKGNEVKVDIKIRKREAVRVAKELLYPRYVISAIRSAMTISEIERIMIDARHNL